ncbi:MAG: radical SAM protein [Clostridiales bacterium]|nr:radical SAM protein [Clostridiales bacterium]
MLELLKECRLCPRNCGVDRSNGQRGFCGAGASVRVGRAALHMWEEPCLSGASGSGTVFFSYCTLQCVYCQNAQISQGHAGKEITVERLAEIFLELQQQGANNINLVTPTHYLPQIINALDIARKDGLRLPIVYNTSGYEKPDMIQKLAGYVDVYLPDFKYYSADSAKKYSAAPDYIEAAKQALETMVRQVGKPQFDDNGIMTKGVIVRHLILPGCYEESKQLLAYLHQQYGDDIYISLMNQYTPFAQVKNYPELNCKIPQKTYEQIIDYAVELGIENGFIQEEGTAEESFIPDFDGQGV